MIDRALLDLMRETVTWSTGGATSAYGVPTFSTAGHAMAARIVYKHGEVRDRNGNVTEAQGVLWCAADTTRASTFRPTADDRLVLPDGKAPPILTLERFDDEVGTNHYKVTFGY